MDDVRGIMEKTLQKMGLRTKALEYKILELWDITVGEGIAKHTSVDSVERGVLFVHVDHHVWVQHLSVSAKDIKDKLNKAVGSKIVKEIRFFAGKKKEKQKNYQNVDNSAIYSVTLTNQDVLEIKETVEIIEDPELRKITASIMQRNRILQLQRKYNGGQACPECGTMTVGGEELCFHCRFKKGKTIKSKAREILWEMPWLSYQEVASCVDGLEDEVYQDTRQELIQQLWGLFKDATKQKKVSEIPRGYIQTYAMLRSGISPERLSNEIIAHTLGENMAKKLLGGQ